MAIYTDSIHLMAESEGRLETLTEAVGLNRKNYHDFRYKYDYLINLKSVKTVVKAGAVVVDIRTLVSMLQDLICSFKK